MPGDGREGGYIKLHRRLRSWSLWQSMTALQQRVWVEMLIEANWKDGEFWYGTTKILVKRGQYATSEAEIAKLAKVDRQVVRDTYAKTEKAGSVTRERNLFGNRALTLVTIVNYERFQGVDDDENPAENRTRTKEEPSENQARTPIEEGEEGEEGKEREPALRLAPPSEPKAKKLADPLRRVLSDALVVVGREERGGSFAFDGARDGQGVSRLLGWSRDVAEHARRFRAALRSPAVDYGYRVDTIAAFATGRIWNHFSSTSTGPARLAKLGAPGSV